MFRWIPRVDPARWPAAPMAARCMHTPRIPDLAWTKCSKHGRRTCRPQHHSWQTAVIVQNDSNQEILNSTDAGDVHSSSQQKIPCTAVLYARRLADGWVTLAFLPHDSLDQARPLTSAQIPGVEMVGANARTRGVLAHGRSGD